MNADHYWFKFLITIPEKNGGQKKKNTFWNTWHHVFFPMFSVKKSAETPAKPKLQVKPRLPLQRKGRSGPGFCNISLFSNNTKNNNMSSPSLTFWMFWCLNLNYLESHVSPCGWFILVVVVVVVFVVVFVVLVVAGHWTQNRCDRSGPGPWPGGFELDLPLFIGKMVVYTLGMVPKLFMGLSIKGTIWRVPLPPFFPMNCVAINHFHVF